MTDRAKHTERHEAREGNWGRNDSKIQEREKRRKEKKGGKRKRRRKVKREKEEGGGNGKVKEDKKTKVESRGQRPEMGEG